MSNGVTEEQIDGGFIVEQLGHKRMAGQVKSVSIAGHGMLRIDMATPDKDGESKSLTQYIAPSTLYALTPTTEDLAKQFMQGRMPEPVSRYDLPRLPAATPPDAEMVDPDDEIADEENSPV
jgi:hypothetical protein